MVEEGRWGEEVGGGGREGWGGGGARSRGERGGRGGGLGRECPRRTASQYIVNIPEFTDKSVCSNMGNKSGRSSLLCF